MSFYRRICRPVEHTDHLMGPMAAWQIDERRGDLFNYLVFLRVTPILPNIFINISSPVVDVPLRPFALGAYTNAVW